ncbi:hypothetical protein CHS0354_003168 [Potamilus streckersoni]|uniref:Ganglioside GM2 activator n=1 Tax=Potamilus streckersoni TaxID=2493646 RepID=A0AAE0TEZ7_9BIVA|nr:hypothetical protein CHS0354_003168 [Potamilus streckersoni]
MKILLLIAAVCILSNAEITNFVWKNCAPAGTNVKLRFNSLSASPMPVLVPGPLSLSINASVLQEMDVFFLKFDISKHTSFGGAIQIPCVSDVGSCTLDGCTLLPTIAQGGHMVDKSLGLQIMSMLKEALGHDAGCPIHVENVLVQNKTLHVPEMGTIASAIGEGDFTIKVTSLDIVTGEIFGCLQFDITIKNKPKVGFLFG